MRATSSSTADLQAEIAALRLEVAELRKRLSQVDAAAGSARVEEPASAGGASEHRSACQNGAAAPQLEWESSGHTLTRGDIERYSRQLILPALGTQGQERLKQASVLVVGAGGLGCPAVLYLAAGGVGRLGIVDRDAVELSNIHRQVAHTEADVGRHKADSAAAAARAINSSIHVEVHRGGLTPSNAFQLVQQYDIVIDASDNAPTRYLASDACVIAGKPLVSGAALGTDGQLTVYNHEDGPCYRCLYPEAPRPDACNRCSDAGVLGPVPGFIGCLQALEAIKLAAGIGTPLARRLLIVDALSSRFSTVQLRPRSPSCAACGESPTITAASLAAYDYGAFTGQAADDAAPCQQLLPLCQRMSAKQLAAAIANAATCNQQGAAAARRPLILDVRPADQFGMCRLPGSFNAPFEELHSRMEELRKLVLKGHSDENGSCLHQHRPVVVVCRRGNDSQAAVQMLAEEGGIDAVDVVSGLQACSRLPQFDFPQY